MGIFKDEDYPPRYSTRCLAVLHIISESGLLFLFFFLFCFCLDRSSSTVHLLAPDFLLVVSFLPSFAFFMGWRREGVRMDVLGLLTAWLKCELSLAATVGWSRLANPQSDRQSKF